MNCIVQGYDLSRSYPCTFIAGKIFANARSMPCSGCKAVLTLKRGLNLSDAEIANAMELPIGYVRQILKSEIR